MVIALATLTVSGETQEIIAEEEFETRFQTDPEALYESCIINKTVVVVTESSNGTWYAVLWKKVKDAECNKISCATVTVTVPNEVEVKADWCDNWQMGGSVSDHTLCGFVVIWFRWNTDETANNKTIYVSVFKDGYLPIEEEITIYGQWKECGCWCYYKCNKRVNTLIPPSPVPEFSFATPLAMSIGTSIYFAFRRIKK